jgi:hypothetical protein
MGRLCRPGGRVVVVEANRLNPIFYLHLTLMGNHQHFTRSRLRALMAEAALEPFELKLLEARVWPFNRVAWQRWAGRLQDLAEAIPLLWPFLCYHLVSWRKPEAMKPVTKPSVRRNYGKR